MIRHATERLPLAAVATTTGALLAVLAGLAEAALLVAPWMVLLALGLSKTRPPDLEGSIRVGAERIVVGDDIEVTASLRAGDGIAKATVLPSQGFWSEQDRLVADRRYSATTAVSADRTIDVTCVLSALEWGTHDIDRVRIDLIQPYGLFRSINVINGAARVRVHPTPTELRDLIAPRLMRRTAGLHESKAADRGIEYADLRQFASGDALRDINWRASARSSDLWVSQRHPDRATEVVLLVDSFVESGHDARMVVGLAIEAARALAESHLTMADRVGLVELGGIVRWVAPRPGKMQLQHITDALLATRLYANAAARDLEVIPPRALPPRSFVLALTPLLDDRFIDALMVLAGRGHDVAVIECHPLSPERAHEDEDWARLALRLWEAERQIVRDELFGHNIAVAGWQQGEELAAAVGELVRRRAHAARTRRR